MALQPYHPFPKKKWFNNQSISKTAHWFIPLTSCGFEWMNLRCGVCNKNSEPFGSNFIPPQKKKQPPSPLPKKRYCNHQPERSAPNKTTPFDPQKSPVSNHMPLGLTLPAGSSGAWPSRAEKKKTQLMPFFLGGICCWFTYVLARL